jgi:hypothetical protein
MHALDLIVGDEGGSGRDERVVGLGGLLEGDEMRWGGHGCD